MPPIIPAIIALGAYAAGYITIQSLALSLLGTLVSVLSQALAGKPHAPSSQPINPSLQQTIRASAEPRRVIYGEARAAGPIVYGGNDDSTTGYLDFIVPVAGHRCFYIGDLFYDATPASVVDANNYVSVGRFQLRQGVAVRIKKHFGALDQTVDTDLKTDVAIWTDRHRGQGVSYFYTKMYFNPSAFPTGLPNISAIVKGRMLYDPRSPGATISTSASGSPGVFTTSSSHGLAVGDPVWILGHTGAVTTQSFPKTGTKVAKEYQVATVPTATTFTVLGPDGNALAITTGGTGGTVTKCLWTNNWALCVRDWLAAGFGLNYNDAVEINDTLIASAANTSDEMVALKQIAETCTASASANQITLDAPVGPLNTGDQVTFANSGGALPSPLVAGTVYYWVAQASLPDGQNVGLLATTLANALTTPTPVTIDLADAGTGTHTLLKAFQKTFVANVALLPANAIQLADDKTYFATGDKVRVASDGTLPSGLSAGTDYYWFSLGSIQTSGINVTPETFALYGGLATSLANARAHVGVTISSAGSGVHTATKTAQPRYTCDGIITRDQSRADTRDNLLTAGGGAMVYSGGQYCLYAAVAGTATLTVDESWLAGGKIELAPAFERSQLYNAVRGQFMDPNRYWQPNDFPPRTNATYEAEDGGEQIFRDLQFPFTQDSTRCQRIANIMLQRSRASQTLTVRLNFKALQLAVWDVQTIDIAKLGINGTFRLLSWSLAIDPQGQNSGIDTVWQEEIATAYDWDQTQVASISAAADVVIPTPFIALPPTSLNVSSGDAELFVASDGTVQARALLTWILPNDVFVTTGGRFEIQFKLSSDTDWSPSQFVGGSTSRAYVSPIDTGSYDFRIRSLNGLNAQSDWLQALNKSLAGKAAPPPAPTNLFRNGNVLTWVYDSPPLDFAGFRIRQVAGRTRNWEQGSDWPTTNAVVRQTSIDITPLATGTRTIMVRAVDTSGNLSTDAVYLTLGLGEPSPANLLDTYDYAAGNYAGGTIVNATASAGVLSANDDGTLYLTTGSALYLPNPTGLYLPISYLDMSFQASLTPPASELPASILLDASITGETWDVVYRKRADGLYLTADDETYLPDGSALYLGGPTEWQAWPGSISMSNPELLDVKAEIAGGSRRGVISAFALEVDVPDITESFSDLAIGATGTRIPITKTYRAIKYIGSVTLQDDGAGAASIRIFDKDPALGPLLKAYSSAGALTTATIDIDGLKGY